MIQAILGIDTSCYITSCALVDIDGRLIADVRQKLRLLQGKPGLRQNRAFFQYARQLPSVLPTVFNKVNQVYLNAFCASHQPLQGINSYMPVSTVGASIIAALLESHRIPCLSPVRKRWRQRSGRCFVWFGTI